MTILALPFVRGYTHYLDALALVGEHKARVTMTLCVERCHSYDAHAFVDGQWISQSVYLNPDNHAGFDIIVTALITELLIVMHEHQCFDSGYKLHPWEFVNISIGKLFIQPKYKEVEEAYPLFRTNNPVLI